MKNNPLRYCLIIFPLLLSLINCNESDLITDNENNKKSYVHINTYKVEIGQKVTAHFINMDSVYVYDVTLNQKDVTYAQLNDSTVTLIVPFTNVGNDVGNFVFYCRLFGESVHDTVLVSNQINYKYENWTYNPKVIWNSSESITEVDSWKMDFIREKQGWSMQTILDTIKFIRRTICHDECSTTETLVFQNNGNNTLPKFLYALYNRNAWMESTTNVELISRCKIIIDKWDDALAYSGTFSAPGYSWVFWCKK